MQARAVMSTATRQVGLRDVEIGAVGEWDVAVELERSAISVGTESYVLATATYPRPYIPGYAPIGRVVEVGDRAAARFSPGDRISYFQPRPPRSVVQGSPCTLQNCGGHQSPAIIDVDPARRDLLASNTYCVTVPEGLSTERAAFGGISSISSLGVTLAAPRVGDRALVIGQGMIGQLAAQHLKLRGAEVAVADRHEPRLELARRSGVDHVIDVRRDNLVETTRALWPDGADIVADATGSYRVVEDAVGALRREGTVLFLAWYKGAGFNLERFHGKVFRACFPWTLKGDHVLASWRLLESGALCVDHLHTHSFPVADAQQAYDLIYRAPQEYVGITLDWSRR
jgi:3-hydroxyethyl bacteriochlorophyllide a dehydrogenase